ncbi:MAG: energy transducer TonB [Pseudomonadota bacterium]
MIPSRAIIMAVIAAGHVAAISLAMLAHGPQRDVEKAEPILVSLLTEQRNELPPPPPSRPVEVVIPDVVVLQVNIEIPQDALPVPLPVAVNPVPPALPSPPSPTMSSGDVSEPVLATAVEYVRPPVVSYPAAAKQARATGTVHIRALVETDGRVREVRVDRSSGYSSLDKAASESVRGALFRPYMHNGVARAAIVIVPVDFELKTRAVKRDHGLRDNRCGKPRDRDEQACDPVQGPQAPALSQALPE